MQKFVSDIYHALGSIKAKIDDIVKEETDDVKKKKLTEISGDILNTRCLIANNLTTKKES